MKKYSAEGIMEQRSEVLDIPTGPGEQQSSLQQERKLCKHHQGGHCRRGDKCNFDHNAEMCDQYNPYSERTCANEKCVKRHPGICPFFILKTCHFGFKCSLSHHADNAYDKVSQRLLILENKLSDPPPSNSLFKDLAVRMSDFEERSKRLNRSINNIRKDLSEVSSEVKRTTISSGLDKAQTCKQVQKSLKEIVSLKIKIDDIEKMLMQKAHEMTIFKANANSLHKTVALIENGNKEMVENIKQCSHLASNIRLNAKEQQNKMDDKQIKIENNIRDLENENQLVHEKLVCLSEYIDENFESFSAADENILSKYSGIEEDINVLKEAMHGTVKVLELLKIINKPPSNDQMIV